MQFVKIIFTFCDIFCKITTVEYFIDIEPEVRQRAGAVMFHITAKTVK